MISTRNASGLASPVLEEPLDRPVGPSCTVSRPGELFSVHGSHEGARRRAPARSQEGSFDEERRCYRCRPGRSVRRDARRPPMRAWYHLPHHQELWAVFSSAQVLSISSATAPSLIDKPLRGVGKPHVASRPRTPTHVTPARPVRINRVAARLVNPDALTSAVRRATCASSPAASALRPARSRPPWERPAVSLKRVPATPSWD